MTSVEAELSALKDDIILLKANNREDHNRYDLAIQNLTTNLKNIAFIAGVPWVELETEMKQRGK